METSARDGLWSVRRRNVSACLIPFVLSLLSTLLYGSFFFNLDFFFFGGGGGICHHINQHPI